MRHTWKGGRSCNLDPRLLAAALLCGSLTAAPGKAAEDEARGAARSKQKPRANLDWVSFETGIERLREKYQPALILFEPGGTSLKAEDPPAGEGPGFLDEHLTDVTLRDVFRRFVLIRIENGDLGRPYPDTRKAAAAGKAEGKREKEKEAAGEPAGDGDPAAAGKAEKPSIGKKLEVREGKPVLIAFSFREETIKRYEGELPTKTQLKRELSRITKVSDLHAREARRIEPELDRSLYAFRLGKTRDAVLKVVPLEDKEARRLMDETLAKKVDGVISEYRARAGDALAAADELEAKKKYEEAIKAYDGVGRDFPFPDILKEANRRKSVTLRKLTVGY